MSHVNKIDPPVDLVLGNLLFSPKPPGKVSRRRCWAGYELQPIHYDLIPADKALAYHDQLTEFLREFSDVKECHLMMAPVAVRAGNTQMELLKSLPGDLYHEAEHYCIQVAEALRFFDDQQVSHFRFYLFLRLPDPPLAYRSLAEWGKAAVNDFRDFMETLAGIGRPEITEKQLEAWDLSEQLMRARLNIFSESSSLRFRQLTTEETQYLVRAPFWRSTGVEPDFAAGWTPGGTFAPGPKGDLLISPDTKAMRRLYAGRIDHQEDEGYLKVTQLVEGQPQTVYQAFLTIEQWCANPIPLLGGEWAYLLQREIGPNPEEKDGSGAVELHIRWTSRDYEATLDDLASQKRKQADTSEQEEEHSGGTSNDTMRSRSEAEEMEAYVKETRSPSLLVSVVVAVSATSVKELRERIRKVQQVFNRLDIKTVQNGPDQFRHFVETIPGAKRLVDDYVHRLLPPALATCMLGATNRLLDPSGTYIGTDDRGNPLWYDPTRALAVLDTSGSVVAVGPMGKGKSLLMNFLSFLCVLLRGARLLAIDSAKPERSAWPDLLPYLGRFTRVVTLSSHEADRGKLDPYNIFENRSEATNHAVSQAAFLTQTKLQDVGYDVLLKAFTEVRDQHEHPCMMAAVEVLERLGRDPDYKYAQVSERLAERLRNISGMAYANLLFGSVGSTGIDTSNRITVLQLDRIVKPPEDKAVQDYTLDEYVSHAIMVAAVALASSFARSDRRQQKVILADEIRWFVNNPYGRDLIEQQTLVGRAMGTQVFLIGQNVSHIPKDLHQHFTMRFAFGAAHEREAIATLEFLGAETTSENIDRLMRLNPGDVKGQCLVRDLMGNIGQAQIDLIFEDLVDAFNTKSLKAEEPHEGVAD